MVLSHRVKFQLIINFFRVKGTGLISLFIATSSRPVVFFDNLNVIFSTFLTKKNIKYDQTRELWCLLASKFFLDVTKKKSALIRARESVTETVDFGSIPGRAKTKTMKIGIHSLLAWRSVLLRDSVKTPRCVVDSWTSDSVTQRLKGPFAVSRPRLLGE